MFYYLQNYQAINKLLLLAFFFFLLIPQSAFSVPIADFRMDECEWNGTAEEVIDAVEGDNNGTRTGINAASTVAGKLCNAGNFTGDVVEVGDLTVDTSEGAKTTVTFWMHWDGTSKVMPFGWEQYSLFLYEKSFGFHTGNGDLYGTDSEVLAKGWHHVAAVFVNGSVADNSIYIDGEQRKLTQRESKPNNKNAYVQSEAGIGGWLANGDYRFQGTIDELKIYNGDIGPAAIESIYKNENSGKNYDGSERECSACTDLISEYRFDECSWNGNKGEVVDSSGNGHHGIATYDATTTLYDGHGGVCRAGIFDGRGDYIEIPDAPELNPGGSFSVSVWFRANSLPWSGLVTKLTDVNPGDGRGWNIQTGDILGKGRNRIASILADESGHFDYLMSQTEPEIGVWYHVVLVHQVDNVNKLYVNGQLEVKKELKVAFTNNPLQVGKFYTNTDNLVFDGAIDEVILFKDALDDSQVKTLYENQLAHKNYDGSVRTCQECGGGIDHFELVHDGHGLTCQAEQVLLKACANKDCSNMYVGEAKATLADLGWLGGATQIFNFTNDSKGVPLKLQHTTAESVNLKVLYSAPEAAEASTCVGGGKDPCSMIFDESGFLFDQEEVGSCEKAKMTIQAVQMDEVSHACVGLNGFAKREKVPIRFWANYVTPQDGWVEVIVNGEKIPTMAAGETGKEQEITLDFDEKARAAFSVVYEDAGKMQLSTRYKGQVVADDGKEQTLILEGAENFIRTPAALAIYAEEKNSDCVSGDATCTAFKKAGETFALKVRAVCGPLDKDLSNNPITQNFRFADIDLKTVLVAPVGGNVGTPRLTSFSIGEKDRGEVKLSQSVSEVGVFTFATPSLKYLQRDNGTWTVVPEAKSMNIGRFTPDHFITSITNNGILQNGCSGFTYSGQPFTYDPLNFPRMLITATGSYGNTTSNYRNDFVKLTTPATQINMPAVTADASTLGADAATLLNLTWTPAASSLIANHDGTLNFTLGTDQFTYVREANALVAPFTSDIHLSITSITDSDGVSATGLPSSFLPAGIDIRYGQVQLQNAYGSEALPLTIPLQAEYYNGTGFIPNSLDSCSAYNSSNLSLNNFQGNLVFGDTTASGSGTLLSGIGNSLSLSAPGVGHDGSVDLLYDLDAAGFTWLKPGGNNPTAKATFGIFKGNTHLIYMRESVW